MVILHMETFTTPTPVLSHYSSLEATAHRQRGLTLFECLAAVVILGVAVVAALTLFDAHSANALEIDDRDEALRLLQRELDLTSLVPYDALGSTSWQTVDTNDDYVSRLTVDSFRDGGLEVDIELRLAVPLTRGATVSVSTVRFPED